MKKRSVPGYREVSVWAPRILGFPFKVIKVTDNNMDEEVAKVFWLYCHLFSANDLTVIYNKAGKPFLPASLEFFYFVFFFF